ncbi:MAG: hypothetical protein LIO91_03720 [Bacteroidales bacterium]|nr:hypothetical protein [Bacteroidales bacterium]
MSTKKYTKEEVNELNAIRAQLSKAISRLENLQKSHYYRRDWDGFCSNLCDIETSVREAETQVTRQIGRIEDWERFGK